MKLVELFNIMMTGLNADGTPYDPASFSSAVTQPSSLAPDSTKDTEMVETRTLKRIRRDAFSAYMDYELEKRAFDLTDMASVDPEDLVAYLAAPDILFALHTAGGYSMPRGDGILFSLPRRMWKELKVSFVRVTNMAQSEMLFIAARLIEKGHIGPLQATTLCTMLASVQNAPDTV
jgi:hypothetical protein